MEIPHVHGRFKILLKSAQLCNACLTLGVICRGLKHPISQLLYSRAYPNDVLYEDLKTYRLLKFNSILQPEKTFPP